MNTIVFFDTETGGLKPEHPTIQLAAIAVAVDDGWHELESFERKIAFDVAKADPEALAMNHFDPAAWKGAPSERQVVEEFGAFLKRHSSVELVSQRTGRPYKVARIGGHNIAGFDLDRVAAMFKRHGAFFPVDFRTALDTRYGAVWLFEGGAAAREPESQPKNFKLTGLAEHFGIPVEGAHEALFDVRLSIALARRIVELWQRPMTAA
jgi:DNA polymerase III epsilon subunit-like protein